MHRNTEIGIRCVFQSFVNRAPFGCCRVFRITRAHCWTISSMGRVQKGGYKGGTKKRGYKKGGYKKRGVQKKGGYKKRGYKKRGVQKKGGTKKRGYKKKGGTKKGGYKRGGTKRGVQKSTNKFFTWPYRGHRRNFFHVQQQISCVVVLWIFVVVYFQ